MFHSRYRQLRRLFSKPTKNEDKDVVSIRASSQLKNDLSPIVTRESLWDANPLSQELVVSEFFLPSLSMEERDDTDKRNQVSRTYLGPAQAGVDYMVANQLGPAEHRRLPASMSDLNTHEMAPYQHAVDAILGDDLQADWL